MSARETAIWSLRQCPVFGRHLSHPAQQECEALNDHHLRSRGSKRGPARIEIPRPRALAAMERIPPPNSRRDENTLCRTVGPAAHDPGIRPSGRRTAAPHRCPERIYRARRTRHGSRRIGSFGERGASATDRSAQQSVSRVELPEYPRMDGQVASIHHTRSTWRTLSESTVLLINGLLRLEP